MKTFFKEQLEHWPLKVLYVSLGITLLALASSVWGSSCGLGSDELQDMLADRGVTSYVECL